MNNTPETAMAKGIPQMTFEEYNQHLKTLPFFKRMATMKVWNEYFFKKVAQENLDKIFTAFDQLDPKVKEALYPKPQ